MCTMHRKKSRTFCSAQGNWNHLLVYPKKEVHFKMHVYSCSFTILNPSQTCRLTV